MNFPGLRYVLLKSYFPVAFLIAITLSVLDATVPAVHGQVVRTVTVTVTAYVTMVQTVPVYVPVTAYVTVASIATSFITSATTAVSVSLSTLTLWNTVTTVRTAAGGIVAPMLGSIFGQYSDLVLIGGGALGGVAVTLTSSRLIGKRARGDMTDAFAEIDKRTDAWQDQVIDAFESVDQGGANVSADDLSQVGNESDSGKSRRKRKPD